MPPPKSSVYKPVPPPKPKPSFNGRSNSQPPSITESNYMNGNYISSQVCLVKAVETFFVFAFFIAKTAMGLCFAASE
jgi:hypothetical protein